MDYQDREREVNLKSMLFAVMHRWRRMIVFALAFAVILGGYKGVKSWQEATDPQAAADRAQAYQAELEEYEQKKESLELQLEKLNNEVEEQRGYLEKSVLMTMNPREFYSAEACFYVSTGYEIMPGMAYQTPDTSADILAAYVRFLTSPALLSAVADEADLELQYLKELVEVIGENDRMLTVRIRCSDRRGAVKIQNLLLSNLETIREQINQSIGEHTLEEMMNEIGPNIDLKLVDQQQKERERLQANMDDAEALQEELEALKAPKQSQVSKMEAVKKAVVFGVLGAVVGIFLVCVAACLGFIFGDRVYSAQELYERFGLKTIGVLAGSRKRNFVDRWLCALEDRPVDNSEAMLELVAVNMERYCPEAKTIMLTGGMTQGEVQSLAEGLQSKMKGVTLLACASLLEDAEAVRHLDSCDAVVLAEKAGQSRYSKVERTCRKLENMGKCAMGCIVVE